MVFLKVKSANNNARMFARRLVALGVAMLFSLITCSGAATAPPQSPAPIVGTFLQITREHQAWPQAQWDQLFSYLKELGLRQLIVQWTIFDDYPVFPRANNPPDPKAPLEMVMSLAAQHHFQVRLGLVYDSGFWSKINRPPDVVAVYLRHLRRQAEDTAAQLTKLYGTHPAFQGWYLPEEIDDIHWQEPAARQVLQEHLGQVRRTLRNLTPKADVAISAFVNGRLDPESLAAFWRDLLSHTGIELVLFQDGIGVNKLSLEELPPYLDALRRLIKPPVGDWRVIVEPFRQISGPPLDHQPFRAVPAGLPRLVQQLHLARRYAPPPLYAFGMTEYMTPLGGEAARRLYQDYLATVVKKNLGGYPPAP